MATEAQKNFKKQMKEIQKELSQKNNEQFFSYIEDSHIDSYYKPKNKRKVAAISLGSIISLFWLGYSIYTWVRPAVNQLAPSSIVQSHNLMSFGEPGIFDSRQAKIIKYIDEVHKLDEKVTEVINTNNKDFNNSLYNKELKENFLVTGSKNKLTLESTIFTLSKIDIPDDMKLYHETVNNKYITAFENIVFCIDTIKSENINNMPQINYQIEKYNLLSKQQTELMTLAFDKAGIKYQKSENGINYWYNK